MASAATAPIPQSTNQYAGFWLRVVAWLIDAIILGVVNSVVGMFFGGGITALIKPGADPSTINMAALITTLGTYLLVTMSIQFAYFAFMESSEKQGTVGKMALGLKVTDMNGQRITLGRAAGRFFGKLLSSMILGIGYAMAGFTEKKQGLHDMLAGTLVVRTK